MPLAFSHNPDDLVDWLWIVLAFAVVLGFLLFVVAVVVRVVRGARRRAARRG